MFKLIAYICLFLSISLRAYALDSILQNHALHAPNNISTNIHSLTSYLIKPCKNDYEKLYVISYWIASHIAYDEYKFKDGKVNWHEMQYTGDILKDKAGICKDFAQLFADMANIAGIRNVKIVGGYVLKNQTALKKTYQFKDMPDTAHAWNQAEYQGRRFYIDTTFMSGKRLTPQRQHANSLKHKLDIKKNGRSDEVFPNVKTEFFDFTPKTEVKKSRLIHLQDKFIR